MKVSTFYEKLNKVDGNIYVIEEEVRLTDGMYEAELQHDNINETTFAVFTGPKLTGARLETYTLSTPSLAPWKRIVRVYADVPVVYLSYETDGDTVEGDDINRVQDAIVETQEALNAEEARAMDAEKKLADDLQAESGRAKTEEIRLDGRIDAESERAQGAEQGLRDDLAAETQRAKGAEKTLTDNLTAETTRAKAAEKTLTDNLATETTRAKAAEKVNSDAITTEKSRATAAEDAIRGTINTNKPNWDDKYTRNEVDNKFSALETAIDWKEAVNTYADLAAAYPKPDDGWTVNVKDTDYTYRWSGTAWIAISANAIPKATQSVDGLLSKEDKTSYDDAYSKRHTHSNKSTLDKLTETLLANWTDAYNKRHEHSNKTVLDKITQALLDNWSAAYTHISNKSNPHVVTVTQIGAAKATHGHGIEDITKLQEALNEKADVGKTDVAGTLTNEDLNDIKDDGSYKATASNGIMNKPVAIGNSGFGMRVYHNAMTYVCQEITSASGIKLFRLWNNAVWSDWSFEPLFLAGALRSGELLVSSGTTGGIQVSGYTIGKSVPSDAKFTDTVYTHPNSGVTAGTYRSVSVNTQGHVTAGTNPTTLAGYGITDAAAKAHNHDSTYLKKGALTWGDLKGV